MPPSKDGWPSLNVVIFPPVMHLVLDNPKIVTPPPEIIDQIHELILEDHRISAKSIAEQLGISRERSGGIAAHPVPKYSECKNPLEKFSP